MWADGLFEFCKRKNNNFVIIFSIVCYFFLSLQESIFHLVSHLYKEPCLLLALQSFCGSHVLSLNNWSSHWIHIKIERLGLRRSRSRGFRLRLDIGIREIFACGIWKHRKFCFWHPESWALGSEIQLKESGIPLTIEIQNPTFTEKDWKWILVSGIHCVESRIQNCLGFPYMGR